MLLKKISSIVICFFLSSCLWDIKEDIQWNEEEYKSNIVRSSDNHLAFPDLCLYKDVWFVTYRESDAHVGGSFAKIKVLKSDDFINWVEINSFEIPGYDLRDPKFSYNEFTDSLYLHIHTVNEENTENKSYGTIKNNIYITYDNLSNNFRKLNQSHIIRYHSRYPADWLWRPIWKDNSMYVAGYKQNDIRLYNYKDLQEEPIIFTTIIGENTTEGCLAFQNDVLYVLFRQKNTALLSRFIFEEWSLQSDNESPYEKKYLAELYDIGGPNILCNDSVIYIGGRVELNKVSIYEYNINNDKLRHIENLISYGYDCGYPGMKLINNSIYGVYYTRNQQLDEFQIRSFVLNLENF